MSDQLVAEAVTYTTYNEHMPPAGLKPAIPAIERLRPHDHWDSLYYYYYYYYYYLLLLLLPWTELDNLTFIFMGVGVKRKAFSTFEHDLTWGPVFATDSYITNKVKS